MNGTDRRVWGSVVALVFAWAGCGGSGGSSSACQVNDDCRAGASCVARRCVAPDAGRGGVDVGTGEAADAGPTFLVDAAPIALVDAAPVGDDAAPPFGRDAGPPSFGSDAGPRDGDDAGPTEDLDAGPISDDHDGGPVPDYPDAGPRVLTDAGPERCTYTRVQANHATSNADEELVIPLQRTQLGSLSVLAVGVVWNRETRAGTMPRPNGWTLVGSRSQAREAPTLPPTSLYVYARTARFAEVRVPALGGNVRVSALALEYARTGVCADDPRRDVFDDGRGSRAALLVSGAPGGRLALGFVMVTDTGESNSPGVVANYARIATGQGGFGRLVAYDRMNEVPASTFEAHWITTQQPWVAGYVVY